MVFRESPRELQTPDKICEDVSKKNRGPLWALGALLGPPVGHLLPPVNAHWSPLNARVRLVVTSVRLVGGQRWPTGGPRSAPGAPGAPLERFLWIFVIKGAQKRAAKNPTFAEVAVNRPGRV